MAAYVSKYYMVVQSSSFTTIFYDILDLRASLATSVLSFSYARVSTSLTVNKMRIDLQDDGSLHIINVQSEQNSPDSTTLIDRILIPMADMENFTI